jgi:hypothetical protein
LVLVGLKKETKMKKKYIVKFSAHDENELIEATCSDHARILAQARRIEMGETNVCIRGVEEIKPFEITIEKYQITNNNGILTVLRNGESWNRDFIGDSFVLTLVHYIEAVQCKNKRIKSNIITLLCRLAEEIKPDRIVILNILDALRKEIDCV